MAVSFPRQLSQLRARYLAHGRARPAYAEALRASALTALPLFLAVALDRPSLVWMGIAAWLVTQADVGGAYPIRALAMGGVALGGTLACLLGWLVGPFPWAAVLAMGLVAGALSLLRALGNTGKTTGTMLVVAFAIALATPVENGSDLWRQAALFLAGGGLAAGLALAFWRVHPFKPVRRALGACFARLASALDELRALESRPSGTDEWEKLVQRTHRDMRDCLEAARKTLLATQLGRGADNRRSAQYGTLVEIADRAFETWIGLCDHLETLAKQPGSEAELQALAPALAALRQRFEALGEDLSRSSRDPGGQALPEESTAQGPRPPAPASPEGAHALQRLRRLSQLSLLAAEAADGLARAPSAAPGTAPSSQRLSEAFGEAKRLLRAQLTPESRAFRHALRLAVATALTLGLTHLLHMTQGAWVLIATLVILQPSLSETWVRGVQRVGGTALGGLLVVALGLLAWPPSVYPLAIALCLFLAMALRHLNYTYFILFVTPAFVLVAHLTRADWHLAVLRLDNTLLGVAIALVSLFLLWPTRERESVKTELAQALEAERALLALLFQPVGGGERVPDAAFASARRQLGLAITNAEDAVQRALAEHGPDDPARSAYFTLTLFLRRLAASVITLLPMRDRLAATAEPEPLRTFARGMNHFLASQAAHLRQPGAEPPASAPDFNAPAEDEAPDALTGCEPMVERMSEQAAVLESALRRLAPQA